MFPGPGISIGPRIKYFDTPSLESRIPEQDTKTVQLWAQRVEGYGARVGVVDSDQAYITQNLE